MAVYFSLMKVVRLQLSHTMFFIIHLYVGQSQPVRWSSGYPKTVSFDAVHRLLEGTALLVVLCWIFTNV